MDDKGSWTTDVMEFCETGRSALARLGGDRTEACFLRNGTLYLARRESHMIEICTPTGALVAWKFD